MTTTSSQSTPTERDLAERLHEEAVKRLVEGGHVSGDPGDSLHRAFREVRLHDHVEWFFKQQFVNCPEIAGPPSDEALQDLYCGISWPTTFGEDGPLSCIMPGEMAAELIRELKPGPGDRVLVISGDTTLFLPALLAEVTEQQVTTVEPHPQIAASARATLDRLTARGRIELAETNGYDIPAGPWQRIITAHGCPGVPEPWLTQLADDGVILMPVAAAGEYGLVRVTRSDTGQPVGQGVLWRDAMPGHGALAHVQDRRLDMGEQGPFRFVDEPAVVHTFTPPLNDRTYSGLRALALIADDRAGCRLIEGLEEITCVIRTPNGHTAAFGPDAVLVGQTESVAPSSGTGTGSPYEPKRDVIPVEEQASEIASTFEDLRQPSFGDWSCGFTSKDLPHGRFWVPGLWVINGPSGSRTLPA